MTSPSWGRFHITFIEEPENEIENHVTVCANTYGIRGLVSQCLLNEVGKLKILETLPQYEMFFVREFPGGGVTFRMMSRRQGDGHSQASQAAAQRHLPEEHSFQLDVRRGGLSNGPLCSHRYTRHDENTTRQFRALCVGAKRHKTHMSVSALSLPRFLASNAGKSYIGQCWRMRMFQVPVRWTSLQYGRTRLSSLIGEVEWAKVWTLRLASLSFPVPIMDSCRKYRRGGVGKIYPILGVSPQELCDVAWPGSTGNTTLYLQRAPVSRWQPLTSPKSSVDQSAFSCHQLKISLVLASSSPRVSGRGHLVLCSIEDSGTIRSTGKTCLQTLIVAPFSRRTALSGKFVSADVEWQRSVIRGFPFNSRRICQAHVVGTCLMRCALKNLTLYRVVIGIPSSTLFNCRFAFPAFLLYLNGKTGSWKVKSRVPLANTVPTLAFSVVQEHAVYTSLYTKASVFSLRARLWLFLNIVGARCGVVVRLLAFLRRGRSRIFACEYRTGRCRWSGGSLGDLPFPPPLRFGAAPHSPRVTLIGSQALDDKSRQNLFPHSVTHCVATQRHDRNTARHARRSDEAPGVRVSVARIAPSLLDLGRAGPSQGVVHDFEARDFLQAQRKSACTSTAIIIQTETTVTHFQLCRALHVYLTRRVPSAGWLVYNRLKAVHDKMSAFQINLRRKSLLPPEHISTGAPRFMRPGELVTLEGKSVSNSNENISMRHALDTTLAMEIQFSTITGDSYSLCKCTGSLVLRSCQFANPVEAAPSICGATQCLLGPAEYFTRSPPNKAGWVSFPARVTARPCIPAPLHVHVVHPWSALKSSLLRAT
ncbi:hypothetical protein PR048_027179 [Dryococelus australis]|uniref:Uncharacterized protein n=1 Tax=Dryococelus australis TaxID=614101 RepID=A0ABQ9GER6_9NEOP|nr:hypothetical protein PR048_027179 [Dryococelus australis]